GRRHGAGGRAQLVSARNRLAALCALVLAVAALLLAAAVAVAQFPRGLIVLACVVVALSAGWYGLVRRGVARAVGLGIAAVAVAVALVLLLSRQPLLTILSVAALALGLAAAKTAFRVHVALPAGAR